MVKSAFKVVVGVTLLTVLLLAGTAQARKTPDDPVNFFIGDEALQAAESIFDVFGSLVHASSGLLEKMRDISDEDLTAINLPMAKVKKPE